MRAWGYYMAGCLVSAATKTGTLDDNEKRCLAHGSDTRYNIVLMTAVIIFRAYFTVSGK